MNIIYKKYIIFNLYMYNSFFISNRWSEAECIRHRLPVTPENQRFVLGNAFSLIRFPLMSKEEFTAGPAQSGLLNYSEVLVLIVLFSIYLICIFIKLFIQKSYILGSFFVFILYIKSKTSSRISNNATLLYDW